MFDITALGLGLHVCWRLVKRFIHNFFHSPDRLHPLVKKLSREVCAPVLKIRREANILQRFDFAGLASGPHVWRGVLRKKWFTTGEGQQIKWNYRCTRAKSNQQCAALGKAAIPSPTIQANVQKEKKNWTFCFFWTWTICLHAVSHLGLWRYRSSWEGLHVGELGTIEARCRL